MLIGLAIISSVELNSGAKTKSVGVDIVVGLVVGVGTAINMRLSVDACVGLAVTCCASDSCTVDKDKIVDNGSCIGNTFPVTCLPITKRTMMAIQRTTIIQMYMPSKFDLFMLDTNR